MAAVSVQQYQRDLRKAMDESRRYHAPDTSQLVNLLSARGLRIVDVPGDGDCFYYAVAHQIFGDISKHTEIRANAVEYVANHPDDFQDFLENGEIDCYLSSLVRDREWADNLAIQATANAYGVIIEVINSNQDQFTGSRVVTPTVNQDTRRIVLGQIEQLHFVSTEIDTPFTISPWGGEMDDTSDILTNTCPLDGPLLWLMSTIHTFSKVKEFIEQQKMCNILNIFNLFIENKISIAKLEWYKGVSGLGYLNARNHRLDLHGSEAQQFFEPILKSPLAKVEFHYSCSNTKCTVNSKKAKIISLTIDKTEHPFESRVQSAITAVKDFCSKCNTISETCRSINTLPPLLIFPTDHLNDEEIPPEKLALEVSNFVITFLLVFLSFNASNHFTAMFKLNPNTNFWFDYDGLREPLVTFIDHVNSFRTKGLGFFVYIQENFVTNRTVGKKKTSTSGKHGYKILWHASCTKNITRRDSE